MARTKRQTGCMSTGGHAPKPVSASAPATAATTGASNLPTSSSSSRQTRSTAQSSGTSTKSNSRDAISQGRDKEEDLPSKVKRLEGMVVRLQNKMEEILDNLLSHRSERIAARAQLDEILDREEEVRLSVVKQLKLCLNASGGDTSRNQNNEQQQEPGVRGVAQKNPSYRRTFDTDTEIQDSVYENVDVGIVIKTEPANDNGALDEADAELDSTRSSEDEDGEQFEMEVDDDSDYVPEPSANSGFVSREQIDKRTPSVKPEPTAGPAPKKRKTSHYTLINSFPDRAKADLHVHSEGVWEEARSTTTINGTKIYYNCKSCSWCPVKMYLFFEKPGAEIHQYVTQDEHDHSNQPELPEQGQGQGYLGIPNSRPVSELQFVTSAKGNDAPVVDGFIFLKESTSQNGKGHYRCIQQPSLKCRARLTIHPDGTFVQKSEHTGHLPNPEKIEAYKLRASMRQMASSNVELRPSEVISQVESMLLLNNDQGINVASMIGSKDSLRRTIQRLQQKARAVIATSDPGAKQIKGQDQAVNSNTGW